MLIAASSRLANCSAVAIQTISSQTNSRQDKEIQQSGQRVFPLLCPMCGGQMRIIAFITHSADIQKMRYHIGVDSDLPHISPARGPRSWDDIGDAQMGKTAIRCTALRAWQTVGHLASKGFANMWLCVSNLRVRVVFQGVFRQPNPCHTWLHSSVEVSILSLHHFPSLQQQYLLQSVRRAPR